VNGRPVSSVKMADSCQPPAILLERLRESQGLFLPNGNSPITDMTRRFFTLNRKGHAPLPAHCTSSAAGPWMNCCCCRFGRCCRSICHMCWQSAAPGPAGHISANPRLTAIALYNWLRMSPPYRKQADSEAAGGFSFRSKCETIRHQPPRQALLMRR
jgi:hypothetical protein